MNIIIDRMAYDPQLKWEGLPEEKNEIKKIIKIIIESKNKRDHFGWLSHGSSFPHEIYNFSEKAKKSGYFYGHLAHFLKLKGEHKFDLVLLCMVDIKDGKWKFIGFYNNVEVNPNMKKEHTIKIKKEFFRNLKDAYLELGINRPSIKIKNETLDFVLKAKELCKFKEFVNIDKENISIGSNFNNAKKINFPVEEYLNIAKNIHKKVLNEKNLNQKEEKEYKEIIEKIDNLLKIIPENKEKQEEKKMENYIEILENHKQMIFYGPPGTGKTREAKRIAYQLIYPNKSVPEKEKDLDNELEESKQFKIVVFHPSYEYDDFMVGIKPVIEGEKLNFKEKHGIFYELREEAKKEENKEKKFVLIIDEINRGNLPKILGELVYALEYRKSTIKLSVTEGKFTIPENIYIIGTMNSADRSIGHIDVAIRRRFALVYMGPNADVVKEIWKNIDETYGNNLASFMDNLNKELQGMAKNSGIVVDEREIGIGHSYFLPNKDETKKEKQKEYLKQKWEYFTKPLLNEYKAIFGNNEELNKIIESIEKFLSKNEPANSGDQSKADEQ